MIGKQMLNQLCSIDERKFKGETKQNMLIILLVVRTKRDNTTIKKINEE